VVKSFVEATVWYIHCKLFIERYYLDTFLSSVYTTRRKSAATTHTFSSISSFVDVFTSRVDPLT
jgi:hypothetical protein